MLQSGGTELMKKKHPHHIKQFRFLLERIHYSPRCCLCPLNTITSPSPLKNQKPSSEYPSTQKEELEALQPLEPHSFV